MPAAKASPPDRRRVLHVTPEIHRKIRILAATRDEDIKDVTAKALEAGMESLRPREAGASPN